MKTLLLAAATVLVSSVSLAAGKTLECVETTDGGKFTHTLVLSDDLTSSAKVEIPGAGTVSLKCVNRALAQDIEGLFCAVDPQFAKNASILYMIDPSLTSAQWIQLGTQDASAFAGYLTRKMPCTQK